MAPGVVLWNTVNSTALVEILKEIQNPKRAHEEKAASLCLRHRSLKDRYTAYSVKSKLFAKVCSIAQHCTRLLITLYRNTFLIREVLRILLSLMLLKRDS